MSKQASEKKSLLDFLMDNPVDGLTEAVVISKRLKDYTFTIKAMTGDEFSRYQSRAMAIGKKNKIDYDNKSFNEQVVLNHTIEPNFKIADDMKKMGCRTPEEFLYKYLNAGEIQELVKRITELSGFDEDEEELVKEAKND